MLVERTISKSRKKGKADKRKSRTGANTDRPDQLLPTQYAVEMLISYLPNAQIRNITDMVKVYKVVREFGNPDEINQISKRTLDMYAAGFLNLEPLIKFHKPSPNESR